jgi:MFS family permease
VSSTLSNNPSIKAEPTTAAPTAGPWFYTLSRYQWFVLAVCTLGWSFDCLDQQLFSLARQPAVTDLLGVPPGDAQIVVYSGYATSILLIGWAVGGLFFGVLGDRWGRSRTMVCTILVYSLFTGLCGFAQTFWDFALYRFLTGLGVGGQFAVGVTLVAETMPDRARPHALGLLQACGALANVAAALIAIAFGRLQQNGVVANDWRWMFAVGALPALLAVVVMRRLHEPAAWRQAVASSEGRRLAGSLTELFGNPHWRRRAIVGLLLVSAGVIGLWGIGYFSIDLNRTIFRQQAEQLARESGEPQCASQIDAEVSWWGGVTSMLFNLGAFFGTYAFGMTSARFGRRPMFAVGFVLAMATTGSAFLLMKTAADVFWMVPVMGFFQLFLFGGYAIYLPELFPTRLRSTGTSFCYNMARIAAAVGPAVLGLLTSAVFTRDRGFEEPMRYAGLAMCSVFLLGLAVLPFAPETKGQPLPD